MVLKVSPVMPFLSGSDDLSGHDLKSPLMPPQSRREKRDDWGLKPGGHETGGLGLWFHLD